MALAASLFWAQPLCKITIPLAANPGKALVIKRQDLVSFGLGANPPDKLLSTGCQLETSHQRQEDDCTAGTYFQLLLSIHFPLSIPNDPGTPLGVSSGVKDCFPKSKGGSHGVFGTTQISNANIPWCSLTGRGRHEVVCSRQLLGIVWHTSDATLQTD